MKFKLSTVCDSTSLPPFNVVQSKKNKVQHCTEENQEGVRQNVLEITLIDAISE